MRIDNTPPKSTIKVLYVAHEPGIDGSNTSLRYLVARLKSLSLIEELMLTPNETVANYYREAGLRASVMPSIYTLPFIEFSGYGKGLCGGLIRQAKGFIRWRCVANVFIPFLKSFNPDIIHLNDNILIMHAEVAHNLGFSVVMHDRSPVAQGTIGFRHALLVAAWQRWVAAIIVICPSYIRRLGNAASIAHVVHNPFDITRFKIVESTSVHNREKKDLCRVLLVGARPEKGLFEAIQALELAKQCRLQVVGMVHASLIEKRWADAVHNCTGYHKKVAKWIASHSETGARIDFLGAVNDVPSVIASNDVVIIPWTTHHFARPLIEAWLMKKPVIAADVDGVAEYCINGVNSSVFPAGNIRALADALVKVSTEQEFADQLGSGGYQTAKEFIGADDCHLKVLEIYKNVLANLKANLNTAKHL